MQTMLEVAVPPLITAGLAAAGFWLSERRKDRNFTHLKRQAVSDENNWVAYLKLWLEADTLLGNSTDPDVMRSRDEVRRQLAESRTRASEIDITATREDEPSALLRAWKRAVLIPLSRPAARAVRWVYWIVLAFGLLYSAWVMRIFASPEFGPVTAVIGTVIALVPLLAVAVPLAFWARRLEAKHAQRPPVRENGGYWQAPPAHYNGFAQQNSPPYPPPGSYNPAGAAPQQPRDHGGRLST